MLGRQELARPIEYQGIDISKKGLQTFESLVQDSHLRSALLDSFAPLPRTYREPEKMLQNIVDAGGLKILRGLSLDPFYPITSYGLLNYFDPVKWNAGQCGDIARWFIYDLEKYGIEKSLNDQGIVISIAQGNSSTFFSQLGWHHVWIELTGDRKNLVIDPSFGKIVDAKEGLYILNEADDLNSKIKKDLFDISAPIIEGYTKKLDNQKNCPNSISENIGAQVLGLSRDNKYCFSLAFESYNDRPFLVVLDPEGIDKEYIWLDQENGTEQVKNMSSNPLSRKAMDDPIAKIQIGAMLERLKGLKLEDAHADDPRLKKIFIDI